MQRCHVTGSTVATQKAAGLTGFSLLTVTPVGGGGELVAEGLVGAAVKNADVRSGLQVVERQYGTLELHGRDPIAVREAAGAVLERLKLTAADARRPEVVASELVTRVHPNQAQLINRMGGANLLLQDETMFLIEATPAAYIATAANRAEKRAPVTLIYAALL